MEIPLKRQAQYLFEPNSLGRYQFGLQEPMYEGENFPELIKSVLGEGLFREYFIDTSDELLENKTSNVVVSVPSHSTAAQIFKEVGRDEAYATGQVATMCIGTISLIEPV